jgi:hypothetical protein
MLIGLLTVIYHTTHPWLQEDRPMIEHTTSAAAPVLALAALPPLLGALWRLIRRFPWAHRAAVRQGRCVDRPCALVLGRVCAVARHTVT